MKNDLKVEQRLYFISKIYRDKLEKLIISPDELRKIYNPSFDDKAWISNYLVVYRETMLSFVPHMTSSRSNIQEIYWSLCSSSKTQDNFRYTLTLIDTIETKHKKLEEYLETFEAYDTDSIDLETAKQTLQKIQKFITKGVSKLERIFKTSQAALVKGYPEKLDYVNLLIEKNRDSLLKLVRKDTWRTYEEKLNTASHKLSELRLKDPEENTIESLEELRGEMEDVLSKQIKASHKSQEEEKIINLLREFVQRNRFIIAPGESYKILNTLPEKTSGQAITSAINILNKLIERINHDNVITEKTEKHQAKRYFFKLIMKILEQSQEEISLEKIHKVINEGKIEDTGYNIKPELLLTIQRTIIETAIKNKEGPFAFWQQEEINLRNKTPKTKLANATIAVDASQAQTSRNKEQLDSLFNRMQDLATQLYNMDKNQHWQLFMLIKEELDDTFMLIKEELDYTSAMIESLVITSTNLEQPGPSHRGY